MKREHLNIDHVTMEFPTPTGAFRALDSVDLVIGKGEFVSLIGHSGCGKSTVLNVVAGLYQATAGGVILDGNEVSEPFAAAVADGLPERRVGGQTGLRQEKKPGRDQGMDRTQPAPGAHGPRYAQAPG